MSKEKQCKCCKEYWWEMNIHSPSGLCPNCYDYVADLEAKLAQAQKTIEIQKMSNDALQEENLDYRYDITDTAYEQAKEMASYWERQYQEEIKELKAKLAGLQQEKIEYTDTINFVETSEPDRVAKELDRLNEKLAESENTVCKHIAELTKIATEKDRKIDKLKQQLAEKDKEIEELKDYIGCRGCVSVIAKLHQYEISFAVEQLEKVKEEFISEDWDLYDTADLLEQVCELRNKQIKFIDNQIKQLKEGK